jgi:hypothetical protein
MTSTIPFNNPITPPITGAARTLVQDKFNESQSLGTSLIDTANETIAQLANLDLTISDSDLTFGSDIVQPDMGSEPTVTRPAPYVSTRPDVTLADIQALKDSLAFSSPTLQVLNLPTFSKIAPEMTEYADPEEIPVDIPDTTQTPGTVTTPTVPTLSLPSQDDIKALQEALDAVPIPNPPQTQRVAFESVLGEFTATPPEPTFIYNERTYNSDLKDAINLGILAYIQNGGTGLAADVEAAIWSRAYDRFSVEKQKAIDAEMRQWEARGHDLPPAAMTSAIREINAEFERRNSDLNRDILIQSSDLAMKNTQFFYNAALQYEKQATDFSNQISNRAFEYAKETVNTAVQQFKLVLDHRQALREDRRLDAEVFKEKVQAELTELQKSRQQLENADLSSNIVMKKADLILRRYEEAKILVALFSEQMRGAELQESMETLKITGFKEFIAAQQAKISLNTSRYNYTQAKWANNETKANVYATEVQAHTNLLNASKVESDIDIARAELDFKANQQTLDVLTAALKKLETESRAASDAEDNAVKAYGAQVDAYRSDIQALTSYLQNIVESYKAQQSSELGFQELSMRQAENNQKIQAAIKELASKTLEAIAQMKSQMGASIFSSVSTSAQMGYSERLSHSYSGNVSDDASRRYSETHTYTEKAASSQDSSQ